MNFLCGYQKMWRWLVFSRSILTDTAQKYNAHIQLSSHPAVALSSHSWNVCFFQAQGFYFSSFLTEWVILHVLPRRALQECHWSTWTACLVILMKTREEKSLWLSWLKGLQMFEAASCNLVSATALKPRRNRHFITIMFVMGFRNCQLYFFTGNFYFEVLLHSKHFYCLYSKLQIYIPGLGISHMCVNICLSIYSWR